MFISLKLEGEVLGINGQTKEAVSINGEVSIVASTNVQLEAGTGGGRTRHGLSVFSNLARVALDEGLSLLLEGVDSFFDGRVGGEEHDTHGGIGVNSVDLLHRPGVSGIVDAKHAGPLDSARYRLGLEEGGCEGERSEGGELHRCSDLRYNVEIMRLVEPAAYLDMAFPDLSLLLRPQTEAANPLPLRTLGLSQF